MDLRTDILPHRDRLYRLALSITGQAVEAEDVVQDVMLRAWERRDEWPSIDNVQAWLVQICKNLSLDRLKKSQYRAQNEFNDAMSHSNASFESFSTVAFQETLEARESFGLLQQLITQLPPPLDDLVRLRDIEGLSYREIAAQLQLTEDQVRVYLHRARTKLKDKYAQIQNYGLE